jgi:hypothetical protein
VYAAAGKWTGEGSSLGSETLDGGEKENWPELLALTSIFFVELPGIEPVSGCWSLSRAGTELRNDTYCDSPELTSVDTECAQNVPSQSLD